MAVAMQGICREREAEQHRFFCGGGALDDMGWMKMLFIRQTSTELAVMDDNHASFGSLS